jgi:hypothetical protein
MRTDRYRFVEWSGPKSKKVVYELYDEEADPLEKINIADRPENAELVAKLAAQLHAGASNRMSQLLKVRKTESPTPILSSH